MLDSKKKDNKTQSLIQDTRGNPDLQKGRLQSEKSIVLVVASLNSLFPYQYHSSNEGHDKEE